MSRYVCLPGFIFQVQGLNFICANTNEIIILEHDFGYDYLVVFIKIFISLRYLISNPEILCGTF